MGFFKSIGKKWNHATKKIGKKFNHAVKLGVKKIAAQLPDKHTMTSIGGSVLRGLAKGGKIVSAIGDAGVEVPFSSDQTNILSQMAVSLKSNNLSTNRNFSLAIVLLA